MVSIAFGMDPESMRQLYCTHAVVQRLPPPSGLAIAIAPPRGRPSGDTAIHHSIGRRGMPESGTSVAPATGGPGGFPHEPVGSGPMQARAAPRWLSSECPLSRAELQLHESCSLGQLTAATLLRHVDTKRKSTQIITFHIARGPIGWHRR
eukprot:SAG31_NODE_1821_length_7194_cov_11.104863_7_plen_150_part_00